MPMSKLKLYLVASALAVGCLLLGAVGYRAQSEWAAHNAKHADQILFNQQAAGAINMLVQECQARGGCRGR